MDISGERESFIIWLKGQDLWLKWCYYLSPCLCQMTNIDLFFTTKFKYQRWCDLSWIRIFWASLSWISSADFEAHSLPPHWFTHSADIRLASTWGKHRGPEDTERKAACLLPNKPLQDIMSLSGMSDQCCVSAVEEEIGQAAWAAGKELRKTSQWALRWLSVWRSCSSLCGQVQCASISGWSDAAKGVSTAPDMSLHKGCGRREATIWLMKGLEGQAEEFTCHP